MKADDIISYAQLVSAERANLQRGMNFGIGRNYSVFLMSLRRNAPYADAIDEATGTLIYEGHDQSRVAGGPDPKTIDQPLKTPRGSLTENGKFFQAAIEYKSGARKRPEFVKVYEKIEDGIWCYKGFFELLDAKFVPCQGRKVCKFYLKPIEKPVGRRLQELPHSRVIPSEVKLEVWKRDRGCCVLCGSTKNLHYDHDLPFSKGGTSLTAANVRLLCVKHNLRKSDKIMCFVPWVCIGIKAVLDVRFR